MSDIKYGLISKIDSECIEATLNYIMSDVPPNKTICTTCIGVFDGDTDRGINEYITRKGYNHTHICIDNEKDKPVLKPFEGCIFIVGNSNEVYNQIPDESQDFIFVDGLHTFAGVVSDFFCYAPKVKVCSYLAFHDTGKHLDPLSGWQGVGDKNDPDFCLGGVRKALEEIGLLDEWIYGTPKFKLVFDEADVNDTGGGICIFQKMY